VTEILRLARQHDRRLRAGHLWVYSNEVDTAQTPLKGFQPGQPVQIEDAGGRWLGLGYVNPNSLICARLVSRVRGAELDSTLLAKRVRVALELRERLYRRPFYRLLFGEADGVPGLVVDRYGDHLVVQLTTAGMERLRDAVVEALVRVLSPRGILLRNDVAIRELEGLERHVEVAHGEIPEHLDVEEGDCRFEVPAFGGQKTGWFFDQAANRDAFVRWVDGRRVLDVFSYVGAWSVRAARAGASEVIAVDASESALAGLGHNTALNDVAGRVSAVRGDAFDVLRELRSAGERFDVVVLDPPAFIKRRKDHKAGLLAYRRLNEAALCLLDRGGLLVTASCSYHLGGHELLALVQQGARHVDRGLQALQAGQQGPDHPVHPAIPETAYLKAFTLRVLPTS
jgi:23S rRNA (cytosine1962-C5)-methyltransferase